VRGRGVGVVRNGPSVSSNVGEASVSVLGPCVIVGMRLSLCLSCRLGGGFDRETCTERGLCLGTGEEGGEGA